MKKITFQNIAIALFFIIGLSSCVDDLELVPIDPNLDTADKVYTSEEKFEQGLAKIYAGFAVSGQTGPDGEGDLGGFDEGHSQYWRGYFVLQQLPTDETVNGWADGNLPKISQVNWGANNEFIRSFYYRALYQVSLANEFIRQANANAKDEWNSVPQMVAEARFLRALSYWHALDLFGNRIPFVDENSPIGSTLPEPAGENVRGPEMFNYIESELLEIAGEQGNSENILPDHSNAMVGQASKGAAWMLLGKLYLNHAVYLGQENDEYYQQAKVFVDKVINEGGFSLVDADDVSPSDSAYNTPYEYLFLADNYRCNNEIIFSINFDGDNSKTWGGTPYIVNAAIGGEMIPSNYGTSEAWGGNRTTAKLVSKFDNNDLRAMWFTEGQSLDIAQLDQFTQGYAVTKYKNITREGGFGSNGGNSAFVDINAPVFRLADAYLMAAEIDLRLNGSVSSASQNYIAALRDRAGIDMPGTIDLDFILDERARELYWECHRRTDLVRFGKFSGGDYVWPFKGGAVNGTSVDAKFDLMPIPFTDITANPNLEQNPDY